MKTFTIENETNNITVHATIQDAEAVANADRFRNEAQLAKLVADWPAARLVDVWNSLPGETQVKKFKERATAVSRIWKAIQSLGNAAPSEEMSEPVSGNSRCRGDSRAGRRSHAGSQRDCPAQSGGSGVHGTGVGYRRCATNARRRAGRGAREEQGHPGEEGAQGG